LKPPIPWEEEIRQIDGPFRRRRRAANLERELAAASARESTLAFLHGVFMGSGMASVMGSRACGVAAWAAAGTASRAFSGSNLVTRGTPGDNSRRGKRGEAGQWACN